MNGGLCPLCDEPLGWPYEIDHRVPYAEVQETRLGNLQATHPFCNRKKGASAVWQTSGTLSPVGIALR
jgi:5-methylcytosine-specific restriction endonuclease McrA